MTPQEYTQAIEEVATMNALAEAAVAKGEAYKRLLSNPDYQLVIQEGYYSEYPKEAAENLAKNTGAYDDDALVRAIKAPQELSIYTFGIIAVADAGEAAIEHNKATLAAMADEMAEVEA